MNVKKWYQKNLQNVATAFSRFWFTISLFLIITSLLLWDINQANPNEELYFSLFLTAFSGIFIQLFYEKYSQLGKPVHVIGYIIVLLANISYYFYLHQVSINDYSASLRTAVLFFMLWIAILWIPSIKRQEPTFSIQLVIFLKSFFTAFLLALVLFLGLSAIVSAYSFLIHELNFETYERIASLTWAGFFPIYLLSLLPDFPNNSDTISQKYLEASRIPKFLEVLLVYILLPVLGVYTAILLVYFLQNIGHFWHDNLLGSLLISYLIIGWILLFLIEMIQNKFVFLFKKYFPPFLIIVTLLQSVATIYDIIHFGLTDGRYFQVLLLLFSIVSSCIYWWRHQKIDWIPGLLIGLSFIATLPFINAVSLSTNSQIQRLETTLTQNKLLKDNQILPNNHLSLDAKEQIVESYQYLRRVNALEKLSYLPNAATNNREFSEIFGFNLYNLENVGTGSESGSIKRGYTIEADPFELPQLNTQNADVWLSLSVSDGLFDLPGQEKATKLPFEFNQQQYHLEWEESKPNSTDTQPSLNLRLFQGEKEFARYDLAFLRELSDYTSIYEHAIQPSSELTFTLTSKQSSVTISLTRIVVREDAPVSADFYLLIKLP